MVQIMAGEWLLSIMRKPNRAIQNEDMQSLRAGRRVYLPRICALITDFLQRLGSRGQQEGKKGRERTMPERVSYPDGLVRFQAVRFAGS
jgi:hypothetical protein